MVGGVWWVGYIGGEEPGLAEIGGEEAEEAVLAEIEPLVCGENHNVAD